MYVMAKPPQFSSKTSWNKKINIDLDSNQNSNKFKKSSVELDIVHGEKKSKLLYQLYSLQLVSQIATKKDTTILGLTPTLLETGFPRRTPAGILSKEKIPQVSPYDERTTHII